MATTTGAASDVHGRPFGGSGSKVSPRTHALVVLPEAMPEPPWAASHAAVPNPRDAPATSIAATVPATSALAIRVAMTASVRRLPFVRCRLARFHGARPPPRTHPGKR